MGNKLTNRPTDQPLFSVHQADARSDPEGGGNGREDGDGDVQNLLPEFVLVHCF